MIKKYINKFIVGIKSVVPFKLKKRIKKIHRKVTMISGGGEVNRMSMQQFEGILKQLNINTGDTLIVHSSYGNVFADFSPSEMINLLLKLLGPNGNLLMPYYPSTNSLRWLKQKKIFHMKKTPSVTGVLTEVLALKPGAQKSIHPIKSMVCYGDDCEFIIGQHSNSVYPYDEFSPYYKSVLMNECKTLGIGIEINSFVHSCEDLFWSNKRKIYHPNPIDGKVQMANGTVVMVKTYVHDPVKMENYPPSRDFLKDTSCPTYNIYKDDYRVIYSVDNKEVLEHTKKLFNRGVDRINYN